MGVEAPRGGVGAMAVAGAGIGLGLLFAAIIAVRSFTSSSSSAAPPAPPSAANAAIALEGAEAPGTAELRALGCDPAIVVDMARLLGGPSSVQPGEPRWMITCDVAPGGTAPECAAIASTYFRVVRAANDPVAVRVLREGTVAPLCSRLYAPSGADLGAFSH